MVLGGEDFGEFLCERDLGGAQLDGKSSTPLMRLQSQDACGPHHFEVSFTNMSGTWLGNWNG